MGKIRTALLAALIIVFCGCGRGSGGGDTSLGSSGVIGSSAPKDAYAGRSVSLSWDAPAANSDGSELTDLAGYKVYYGQVSGSYSDSVDVGNTTDAAISGLSSGTWCFAVTAYDVAGNESSFSDEACIL